MFLNGDAGQGPGPFGLPVADLLAGAAIVQGALAALVRRGRTGQGAEVRTSLVECLLDFQFEVLTTHLNDGGRLPCRSAFRNAHAYLAAPYGIYPTADGYLALAMMPLDRLAPLLDLPELAGLDDSAAFQRRDALKRVIAARLAEGSTKSWLSVLEPRDIWCAGVLDWATLLREEAFRRLDMLQDLPCQGGGTVTTLRSPIRVDGMRTRSATAAPLPGQHTGKIRRDFGL